MIESVRKTRLVRCAILMVALWAGVAAPKASANDQKAEALVRSFAKLPGVEAKFREEKTIALLATPLINEGTVHFSRPGYFARHTLKPEKNSIVIRGELVESGTKKQKETLRTGQHPVLRSFVQGYMGLLAGDFDALKKSYKLTYREPNKGAWSIRLVPRDKRLLSVIKSIEMSGEGQNVSHMVIVEASGDVSRTTFSDVNVSRSYSKQERSRIFQLR